ncbi:hypothetical protein DF16_pBMB293orf00212 (plasmid) [Bacillus thuringiensis serovar kurstaki str. YBT-1520]|nr:hypothetical protein DF16_pBMB293orf00212 [Bacillus thuringiensis serovar kurstaki str. YBT-1520]
MSQKINNSMQCYFFKFKYFYYLIPFNCIFENFYVIYGYFFV